MIMVVYDQIVLGNVFETYFIKNSSRVIVTIGNELGVLVISS